VGGNYKEKKILNLKICELCNTHVIFNFFLFGLIDGERLWIYYENIMLFSFVFNDECEKHTNFF